jgi:hypothetical protein
MPLKLISDYQNFKINLKQTISRSKKFKQMNSFIHVNLRLKITNPKVKLLINIKFQNIFQNKQAVNLGLF